MSRTEKGEGRKQTSGCQEWEDLWTEPPLTGVGFSFQVRRLLGKHTDVGAREPCECTGGPGAAHLKFLNFLLRVCYHQTLFQSFKVVLVARRDDSAVRSIQFLHRT